jgi:hypothetical protein
VRILFQDQAEYYFVCEACYDTFCDMQWAGSTHSYGNWRGRAQAELEAHIKAGKPCEFCGPDGNGGWMVNGHWPAAEARDARKTGR